ncbi:hypothetical protein ETB97_008417 [Aspergillus alliaceus]|uniref:ATP-dependent DNA helicase n=1 Tax=Petromyces alliaceus TaxID=209559 RepID=A0A8H6E241_PETAA|nr:hypothetical protein ETB97_008417 [Aspergillus burnettii]
MIFVQITHSITIRTTPLIWLRRILRATSPHKVPLWANAAYRSHSATNMTLEVDPELNFVHQHRAFLRARADTARIKMNADQRSIFERILDQQEPHRRACFFVDGRAGRGKTFLMAALWDHCNILRLTIPIRYAGDPSYATWVD